MLRTFYAFSETFLSPRVCSCILKTKKPFHLRIYACMQVNPILSRYQQRVPSLCHQLHLQCSTLHSLRTVLRTVATLHCLISYASCSQTSHRVPVTAVQWGTNSQNTNSKKELIVSNSASYSREPSSIFDLASDILNIIHLIFRSKLN
jgi:hypothetical protein